MTGDRAWVRKQRAVAIAYLKRERLTHRGVGRWPAFHVQPYVAIWAVQSNATPGAIGWWAITGDCPCDYISAAGITDPRMALRAFGRAWRSMARSLKQGRRPPRAALGTSDNRKLLGRLLAARSRILLDWAADPTLWRA